MLIYATNSLKKTQSWKSRSRQLSTKPSINPHQNNLSLIRRLVQAKRKEQDDMLGDMALATSPSLFPMLFMRTY